jgi:S-DNA-T family DNA segregation ATPase FtsK/SpoIIIE
LILVGLHRARELRDTDQYGGPGPLAQKLAEICREGPDLGVHVITWCDTYADVCRILDRRVASEFDLRVALQMSEDDSNQLIESPAAARLGRNRALLYDVEEIGRHEKFRPYELLSPEEVREVAERLRART